MNKGQFIKWFLLAICIFSIPLIFCAPIEQQQNIPDDGDDRKSYSNIIRALRENWESPIMYLKKRGYIPRDIEPMYLTKLNKNRGADDNEDKGDDDPRTIYDFSKNVQVRDNMIDSLATELKPLPQSILYTPVSNSAASSSTSFGAGHSASGTATPSKVATNSDGVVKPAKVGTTAAKTMPQSILYTPSPRKSFLKNMKEKFLGLFSGKKKSHNGAYSNEFDENEEYDKADVYIGKDYLKEFDKELLGKKFNKDRDYDKEVMNINSKHLRSVARYNDQANDN